MPIRATDYSKTIIYKLVCNDPNVMEMYVGHTTDFKHTLPIIKIHIQ